MSEILLETRDLSKHFPIQSGFLRGKTFDYVKAVDEVGFTIREGETFSLVGESGCGKTTAASLILLLQTPTSGDVRSRSGKACWTLSFQRSAQNAQKFRSPRQRQRNRSCRKDLAPPWRLRAVPLQRVPFSSAATSRRLRTTPAS